MSTATKYPSPRTVVATLAIALLWCVSCSAPDAPKQTRGLQPATTVGNNGDTPMSYPIPAAPGRSTGIPDASGTAETSLQPSGPSGVATPSAVEQNGFAGDVKRCPVQYPTRIANRRITGLGDELVPIEATKVRICVYERSGGGVPRLVATGTRSDDGARRLRDAANNLTAAGGPGDPTLPSCASASRMQYVLTFASDEQRVVIWDQGCPYLTNNGVTALTGQYQTELTGSVVRLAGK